MLALGHEVPAVVVGLGAGVVVHEDLVQGLEGQIALIGVGGDAVGVGPVLRDEGVEDAGLDHLALDLVAVLDERHGEGAGVLQGVGGQLIEDLVVLRLLPIILEGVARVDALQVLDEEGQGGLAAAGVADAKEGLAVGLLNGLGGQLLERHGLGLGNYLLSGRELNVGGGVVRGGRAHFAAVESGRVGGGRLGGAAAGHQADQHQGDKEQRQKFFQVGVPPSLFSVDTLPGPGRRIIQTQTPHARSFCVYSTKLFRPLPPRILRFF